MMRIVYILGALALLVRCGGDEIDRAINDLGKTEKKVRDAQMELRLTSKDAMPKLIEAMGEAKRSVKARKNIMETIGMVVQRSGDERPREALIGLFSDPENEIRLAALTAIAKMEMDSVTAVAVRSLLNDESPEVREKADEVLREGVLKVLEQARNAERQEKQEEAGRLYVRATEYHPRSGRARYELARFYDRNGKPEKASGIYKALHMIRTWWVLGPFDSPDRKGFEISYPPEKEVDLSKAYPGKDGEMVRWTKWTAPEHGLLDFQEIWGATDDAVGFALCDLYSPDERDARLLLGSDDNVKVWLNGEEVHAHRAWRGCFADDDKVDVHLKKGANRLLVKVCEGMGDWALILRVTDRNEAAMEDVVYRTEG